MNSSQSAESGGEIAGESLGQRVQSLRLPQNAGGSGQLSGRIAWGLCVILAGTTAWFAYIAWSGNGGNTVATSESDGAINPAAIAERPSAEPTDADAGQLVLQSKGYIIPTQQILVSPEVSGRVVKLSIEEGMRVKKGDVLAEIESIEYRADHDRAKAAHELARQRLLELERGTRPEEITQAEKEVDESKSQLAQAEQEVLRIRRLLASNSIAAQDAEEAESRFEGNGHRVARLEARLELLRKGPRVEQIEVARAELNRAAADMAKTQWRLDNCTIRAPVSGTILKKNAEEGNIVNPVAFNGSFSLCEMADLSDLEVELDIQERDIARVFKGQKCKVTAAEAFPDRVYEGYVARLMPIADRAKGAVPVRVKVAIPKSEEGVYLKPEMGAVVSFYGSNSDNGTQPGPAEGAHAGTPERRAPE